MATVSVAMAIRDGARFLEAQLRSLVTQTRMPDEVVVCDDGSTDGSAELCEAVLRASGVASVVLRNEHPIGPYGSFSRALSATRGDLVLLCDQDDVWYPEKIELTTAYLSEHPNVAVVVHDVDICRSDLSEVGQTKFERMTLLGLPLDSNVTGMSTISRRSVIDAAFPLADPSATSHDAWLHWVAGHFGERAVYPRSLAAFRRHESNVTRDLLVNRGVKVVRRPRFHRLRQAWRARGAGQWIARARRLAALEVGWLESAAPRHGVPLARIEQSLAETRSRVRALDDVERIACAPAPWRWVRALAMSGAWRPHLALLGPSLVVGALLYGTRKR